MDNLKKFLAPALILFGMGAVSGSIMLGMSWASDQNDLGGTPVNIIEGILALNGSPLFSASGTTPGQIWGYDDDGQRLKLLWPELTGNIDLTLPAALPAGSNYPVVGNSSGVLSFGSTALPSTFISGSGTDNHIVRWDGTGDIQDSLWSIGDTGLLEYNNGTDETEIRPGLVNIYPDAGGTGYALQVKLFSSTVPQFILGGDGTMQWGDGSGGADVSLSRLAANLLGLAAGDAFVVGSTAGNHASTTEGTISYDSVSDTFEGYANGSWVTLGSTGGGYDTIEDEATPLTQRTTINFTGAGVTATDSGGKTVVTIPGGGGMTSWTIAGDSGSESVADGETAAVAGSDGIDTAESGTRTVVVSLDLNELTAADDIDVKLDEMSYGDNSGGDNNTILPVDLIYTLQARRMPVMMDEFLDPTTGVVTAYTLHMGNLQVNGASAGMIGVAGTAAHPGVAAVRTGTATTGRAAIAGGDTAILFGGGEWRMTVICLIAVASDGTDTFTVRMGFNDSITGDGTDSAMFRYTHSVNGGEWEAVTQAAGVETGSATDTNVALDTANFVRFDIVVNAAGTSVEFFINGSSVATNSSNVPTAATGLMPVSIIKSAGSNSRQVQMDFAAAYNILTTRR